jgi:hypothetical protein
MLRRLGIASGTHTRASELTLFILVTVLGPPVSLTPWTHTHPFLSPCACPTSSQSTHPPTHPFILPPPLPSPPLPCPPLPWPCSQFVEGLWGSEKQVAWVDTQGVEDPKLFVWPGKGVYAVFGRKPEAQHGSPYCKEPIFVQFFVQVGGWGQWHT